MICAVHTNVSQLRFCLKQRRAIHLQRHVDRLTFNQIADRHHNEDNEVVAETIRHDITVMDIILLHCTQTLRLVLSNTRNTDDGESILEVGYMEIDSFLYCLQ